MKLDYDYLSKLSRDIVLHTSRKTSNILEGSFGSVNRGKSLDFDDLREYVPGDDFHDIDWKSSSRADKLLIRRYVALRKHNVLFLMDAGTKMDADTTSGEPKSELALLLFGTLSYLLGRQGADFALMRGASSGIELSPFRSDTLHLEHLMRQAGDAITSPSAIPLPGLLEQAEAMHRRMIVMVITDPDGLRQISEPLLNRLSINNDVCFFSLEDAYLTGPRVFDTSDRTYTDRFIARSAKLRALEEDERNEILSEFRRIARRTRTSLSVLASQSEVLDTIINLFERRKYEFFG